MSSSIPPANRQVNLQALVDLESCTEESVVAPGFIQAHGILFVLQGPELTIYQVSHNVEFLLGVTAEALVGASLQQVLSPVQYERVVQALTQEYAGMGTAFELKVAGKAASSQTDGKSYPFRCQLHPIDNGVILEMEPQDQEKPASVLGLYHRLQSAILELRQSNSLLGLAQRLAHIFHELTGFDRVMVYRFEANDHGVVIAEEKVPYLESFLGLHYPAFDIPEPARRLFLRNWVRMIPDVNAPAVALFPPLPDRPLDLSATVLRGVSPYHSEYLRNMGVAATFTIALAENQRLWGLIACHHYSPKRVDYELRKTCELLGQLASIELMHQQSRELSQYQLQVRAIQDRLQQAFLQDANFIEPVLTRYSHQLLDLVHAQGAAILLDNHLTLIGQTPTEAEVQALASWLLEHHPERVFATHTLSQVYPPAQAFKDSASGLLAVSIWLSRIQEKSYHILWFRPEQVQTVDWAGNPQEALSVDELGQMCLCPRKSFELWKEIVQEQAYPWQSLELAAANEMRNTLMLAVLEFSQAALAAEAERAAFANQAKSQFLAKMSHELRTPLNAILGFTQVMLRDKSVPVEFQETLGIIGRSGEHLLALINDVLEMSKIEAGQMQLADRSFDLMHLLRSLQDMFALKASEKGLHLHLKQKDNLPRYICGDEAKIRQILINLLSNAIKFTEQGQVLVTVWVQMSPSVALSDRLATDPVILCIDVTDTGCGIPAAEQETIFEAFRQTEKGHHFQGTGLGLSISRQFARLMGGDITVHSHPEDTTFSCRVNVHIPDVITWVPVDQSNHIVAIEPDQPTYRILIAEDVLENQQLLCTLLAPFRFELHTVENGEDAIAQWQTWHPHLVLMDIRMPRLDGYGATRRIRELEVLNRSKRQTKIIALTAYAFEEDRTHSRQAGCDDYIAKPFGPEDLLEKIGHHLGIRYIYADPALAIPQSIQAQVPLTREDLAVLPTAWLKAAYEAALDLNDATLRQLIAQIPPPHQVLAEALTNLVENFQLEEIAQLTGE